MILLVNTHKKKQKKKQKETYQQSNLKQQNVNGEQC